MGVINQRGPSTEYATLDPFFIFAFPGVLGISGWWADLCARAAIEGGSDWRLTSNTSEIAERGRISHV